MAEANRRIVRNRLVVHIHGYQLTPPERFHRRFGRDLATFGKTWSLETQTGAMALAGTQARWEVEVSGPDWRTRTDYRIIRLDDLIEARNRQPLLKRFARGVLGLFDFVFDRALVGYVRFNWRYALFTLFPVAVLLLAGLAGAGAGFASAALGGPLLGLAGGLAAFCTVIAFAAWKAYFFTLLEDWDFASVLVRRLEPEIEARLEEGRRAIADAIAAGEHDEILVIGHSLGAALALHLGERLVGGLPADSLADPHRPRLGLLTIGSSVLKIGLHRRAEIIRQATRRLTDSPIVVWADYQSGFDVMNFVDTDPAIAMGVSARFAPVVRRAPFTKMLRQEEYESLKHSYFRAHNQFFHASTLRSVYDYFMFVGGPFLFSDTVYEPEGAQPWLDGTGRLTEAAPRGPLSAGEAHRGARAPAPGTPSSGAAP